MTTTDDRVGALAPPSRDPLLRPRDLPAVRDAIRTDLRRTILDYAAFTKGGDAGSKSARRRQVIRWAYERAEQQDSELAMAELFYVTKDMGQLALAAAATLPPDLDLTDPLAWPSDAGFVYFDGGIGFSGLIGNPEAAAVDGEETQISLIRCYGMLWSRMANGVMFNVAYSRADEPATIDGSFPSPWKTAPLLLTTVDQNNPFRFKTPDDFTYSGSVTRQDDVLNARLFASVTAALQLMQQPLTTTSRIAARGGRDRHAAVRRPLVGVTIVDLRPSLARAEAVDLDAGGHLSVRFIVRGTWRNQPYGPGNSLRRAQYIPAFWKGPAGAPVLIREVVNVWKR